MSEELREKILKYLETVSQARNKEVARAVGMEKGLVDKMIGDRQKKGRLSIGVLGESPISPFPGSTRPERPWFLPIVFFRTVIVLILC